MIFRFLNKLFCFSIVLIILAAPAVSQEPVGPASGDEKESEQETSRLSRLFKSDDEDSGARYRLLPIPIFITEPAIGQGLGLVLALFHPVKPGQGTTPTTATPGSIAQIDESREAPPVVTGVFGGYTSSESWMAGIGHSNHWRDDSIRYAGAVGAGRINSDFYLFNLPFAYSMDGLLTYQDIKFRMGSSDWFLGTSLNYLKADNTFELGLPDGLDDDPFSQDFQNLGLALRASYDARDNTTFPRKGLFVDSALWRYDEGIGGDFNYWSAKLKALWFRPLGEKFTLGLRLDVSAVDGSPPFFAYPWVSLRGIPAMRYQDKLAGAVEAELRYRLAPRWEVLAFGGGGFTSDKVPFFDNPGSIYSFGAGARFNIFEAHGVWVGLDAARGPEEWAWYVQVGHAW